MFEVRYRSESWRTPAALVAVAAGYCLLGVASVWTRIPPGFVLPLFPATGLALAAVYLGGRRQLAAIALAAVVFNIFRQWGMEPGVNAVMLGLGIATGSVLQALAGASLLHAWSARAWSVRAWSARASLPRAGTTTAGTTRPRSVRPLALVLPAQVLGGPAACLVAATINTVIFVVAGQIEMSESGRFFLTWWSGDAAGVIVSIPFILAIAERRGLRIHLGLLCVPLSVALFLLLLTFDAVRERNQVGFRHHFQLDAGLVGQQLQQSVDLHLEVLRGVGRALAQAPPTSEEAFRRLVGEPLSRYESLDALSWNPVIELSDRDRHEREMRAAGLPDYQIRSLGRALDRHVVIDFIEPLAKNRSARGVDIYSDARRRRAILAAEVQGRAALTGPITLVQSVDDETGVLMLQPVIVGGELQGFAVAVLRVGALLERRLRGIADPELSYVLIDPADDGGLLSKLGVPSEAWDYSSENRLDPAGLFADRGLVVADRQWRLIVVAPQAWLDRRVDWWAWSVLLGCVVLVGMFGSLLAGLLLRGSVVAEEVARQTAALERAMVRLATARDEANRASRAKSDFLETISHEIRTPLNGVLGSAQLLAKSDLDEEQHERLSVIQSCGWILLALINDVLDLSKIEAGQLELLSEPMDLWRVVREVGNTFEQQLKDKGVELRIALPDLDSRVLSDPLRWRQLLFNLVGNAVKFTAEGSVVIALDCREQGHELAVELTVRDSGIGISPEVRSHLFERFRQGDASTSRRFGGSGLGLSICHRLVSLMGGEISVDDNPGGGSVFTISALLPKGPPRAGEDGPPTSAEREDLARLGRARVLLVDDNEINLMIARATLEALGMTVETADGGAVAVAKAADGYDVILMDLQMPEVDGWAATRRIRADEAAHVRPRVPIIALTASAFSDTGAACEAAGMDGHLAKPWADEELRSVLSRVLRDPP